MCKFTRASGIAFILVGVYPTFQTGVSFKHCSGIQPIMLNPFQADFIPSCRAIAILGIKKSTNSYWSLHTEVFVVPNVVWMGYQHHLDTLNVRKLLLSEGSKHYRKISLTRMTGKG